MITREFSVPDSVEKSISGALQKYGLTLESSKEIADCVLKLSDFFIQNPDKATPWSEKWAQVAYLAYYLPLNRARIEAIWREAHNRGFAEGIEHVIDFGAGLATASLVLEEDKKFSFTLVEQASAPKELIQNFFDLKAQWLTAINAKDLKAPQKTLALFSYSLTELEELPAWAASCDALMIAEPSTQQDGRKLLELRQKLLSRGYHVWAPCTHELACPLLTQSKYDWCHDRIHFKAPDWFKRLEEKLPIKNQTLTFSYLLMRKTAPPKLSGARTVGDLLKEKGKDRQLICQGPEREFLAWLHKKGLRQEIPRGVLVQVPPSIHKVSNELRVESELEVFE